MPTKTSTRKSTRKSASVPTQEEANAVADMIAEAAAIVETPDQNEADEVAMDATQVVDREAARAAKIKAACEADYRVQAVQAHAEQNYNEGGWDVVLEAMEAVDIYWVVYKARSSKGAIARMAEHIGAYAEHRAEIVNA